jgi:cytochrome P450
MRLYPPAWIVGRRAVEPLTVDGYTIPAGSLVATSQWIVHRDPRWWGDGSTFRPARWMNQSGHFDDAATGAPRGAYFPFGAGRRVCVGESFAWTEAVLVLATLAQVWAPATVGAASMATRPAVTLRPADAVPMRLGYRR